MYEISQEHYSGPLDLLLRLVEEKKFEITFISLAEVTEDFLRRMEEIAEEEPHELADFLVIASKLLLIKSKALLPELPLGDEAEEDIRDLELRLVIYREIMGAKRHLKELWSDAPQMLSREFMASSNRVFFPPVDVTPTALVGAFANIVAELEKIFAPVKIVKNSLLNIRVKIKQILECLQAGSAGFTSIHGSGSRSELIVLFLAVLHLVRDRVIDAEQDAHFGEITLRKITH